MPIQFSDDSSFTTGSTNFITRNDGDGYLLLNDFNTVHYYVGNDNDRSIVMNTGVLEDAVYEVYWMDRDTNADNNDPYISVNDTNYSNQMRNRYHSFDEGPDVYEITNQTTNRFYFDHVGGSIGEEGCGYFQITTSRNRKTVIYHGGDTAAIVYGSGVWRNGSTVYNTIGRLDGVASGATLRAWVKRLA